MANFEKSYIMVRFLDHSLSRRLVPIHPVLSVKTVCAINIKTIWQLSEVFQS